jgi:hypothetical protein
MRLPSMNTFARVLSTITSALRAWCSMPTWILKRSARTQPVSSTVTCRCFDDQSGWARAWLAGPATGVALQRSIGVCRPMPWWGRSVL